TIRQDRYQTYQRDAGHARENSGALARKYRPPLLLSPSVEGIFQAHSASKGKLGFPSHGETLMRNLLACLVVGVVCAAAGAEGEVDGLLKELQSPDSDLRRAAARRLGELKAEAKAAAPALVNAVKNDKDLFVRRFAAQALGEVGADPKTAVPAL